MSKGTRRGRDPVDCGWCFGEMVPLEVTHPDPSKDDPDAGESVGRVCKGCGRIYLDRLDRYDHTIRLDTTDGRYWDG